MKRKQDTLTPIKNLVVSLGETIEEIKIIEKVGDRQEVVSGVIITTKNRKNWDQILSGLGFVQGFNNPKSPCEQSRCWMKKYELPSVLFFGNGIQVYKNGLIRYSNVSV